jgi:SAM-dependent methyltransferase
VSSQVVIWHDLECGSYAADLPTWRALAEAAGGPVLDIGAGTGRVTLDLARRGHEVVALDRDGELLAELRSRAADLPVETAEADARDFHLGRRFALVIVPMQTIQILGGRAGREAFLRCAHEHLEPGALLVATLAVGLEGFDAAEHTELPLPDVAEHGKWVYSSQAVGIRVEDGVNVVERVRQTVSPSGEHTALRDEVHLDVLDADDLAAEARALGYDPLPPGEIEPTHEHVGSVVVVLRGSDPLSGGVRPP